MCKLDDHPAALLSPRSMMIKKEQEVHDLYQSLLEREMKVAEQERKCELMMRQLQERLKDEESQDDDEVEESIKELKNYWNKGGWIKSCIFGGLDGLTTIIALILSGTAAGPALVSDMAMLILGIANLLADGFSMGMGDYLSSMAEGDVMKNPAAHGLAWRNGLVMFFSFVFFGAVPLSSFLPCLHLSYESRFPVVCILAVLVLFALGTIKGKLTGQARPFQAGVKMVLMGSSASILSYFVSLAMTSISVPASHSGI